MRFTRIWRDCNCPFSYPPAIRIPYIIDQILIDIGDSNLGYNRHDPSTVRRDKLPVLNEKGMILDYGVTHEQWVWDIRGEEGVVDAFKKVYDDEDLIVSFDVVNVGFAKYLPPLFLSWYCCGMMLTCWLLCV